MPCVKSGARAGSLYRNLVAHALTLGASGDRAPVRQQPCVYTKSLRLIFPRINGPIIELTKQDGRKKRTAKRLCVINVTALLLACYVVIFS